MAFESDLNDVRFANPMSARTPRPASGDSATFDSEQGSVEVTPKTPPTREQAVAGETSFANPAVVDKKGSARMRRPVHECEIREDENSRTWSPDFFALLSDALQRIVAQWDPVTELFGEIDADGDGELDVGEVRQLLGQKLSRTEIKVAFQQMDRDGSGAVDIEEFRGWWDTNVVDPNGAFNKHLSQISRKEIQQEMHKLFQKTHSLDASPNPEAGGRTHCPDFDEPLPADTFYTLLEETLCFTLSADDRRHMTEQLEVAALTAWEESMKGGRAPEGSAHSITAFLRLWDHFFEFDERDPVKEALETLSSSYLLSPFSRFRQDWDVAQSLLLVYVGIAVPYRIGFSDHVRLWSFFFWLDLLVDLYFITDIFVNLRTAVLAKNGAIIYKSREIFKVYLKGWLLIDVTSCLPFGYMQYASSDHSTNSSRMVRLLRLLKLLRLTRITSMLERWEEALYSVRHLKLLLVLVCLFGAAHAIACAWAYVGTTAGTVLPDGTTMHGWVIDKYHDWEKVGSGTLYADAFTWASSAALMVGSDSDMPSTPRKMSEKVVYVVSYMVGAVTIATIIGQVSDIIAHSNPGSTAQADAVGLVNSFLMERQVPSTLLRRIRAHYMQFYRNRGGVVEIDKIMRDMPHTLQLELGAALGFLDDPNTRRRSMLCKIPFFQGLGNDDLIRIGCKLRHVQVPPTTLAASEAELEYEDTSSRNFGAPGFIMREGDRSEEMWVIIDGIVKIQSGFGDRCVELGKLREGDYFGEMAVLAEESPGVPLPRFRSAWASGVKAVVLYSLTYTSVQELRAASPHIDATVREAEMTLRRNRPSLFPPAQTVRGFRNQPGIGSVATVADRLAQLELTVQAGFEQADVVELHTEVKQLNAKMDKQVKELNAKLDQVLKAVESRGAA